MTRAGRQRRRLLAAITAAPLLSLQYAFATTGHPGRLVAAWDNANGAHFVGRLHAGEAIRVLDFVEVPTRAHGLACAADGSVLAVARRPGDWLLRWSPGQDVRWLWADDNRRFSGHVLVAPDRDAFYTTEFDLDTGLGQLVLRDARTLAPLAVRPTHGRDPHDIERLPDGTILVANGGIETRPETGRAKHNLAHMESSLVRIDANRGALRGQWRLEDSRLSIRHLARHPSGAIGVALQAEHDELASRSGAPVFAILDLEREVLQADASINTPAGYAGDIAAVQDGWLVSCPKDDRVIVVPRSGKVVDHRLAQACAIAPSASAGLAWVLGNAASLRIRSVQAQPERSPELRFDNHAIAAT